MFYWYDVYNDYTLELCDTTPTAHDLEEMDTVTTDFGIFYAYDFNDEGPLFLKSENSNLGGLNCEDLFF